MSIPSFFSKPVARPRMRVSSLLGRNASRCDFKQLFPRLAGVALHGETGATQTGMARDITFRVLDVLASTDLVAAEDTRSLHRLVEILGVPSEGHSNPRLSRSLHAGARGLFTQVRAARYWMRLRPGCRLPIRLSSTLYKRSLTSRFRKSRLRRFLPELTQGGK